jgi:type I restriction enzyme S subunit
MAIITTTQLSKISSYRLDAQYYDPIQLGNDEILKKSQNKTLLHLANVNGGKRLPKGEPFSENGFPYIRVVDIQNSFIDDNKAAFISERVWKVISKYDIKLDDILVTIVGNTVGLTGLLNKDLGIANFTENCARIRNCKIDPYYILAFLISKYGQNQVEREKVGTSQPKLSLDRLRRFRIFIPEINEIEYIANLLKKSSYNLLQAQTLYKQATDLLEQELGLDEISFEKPKSYRASFSEALYFSRIDSEHYQPRYRKISEIIINYKAGYERLIANITAVKPSYNLLNHPSDKIQYIELSNINPGMGYIDKIESINKDDAPSRAKRIVKSGDVIASSVVGSVEKAGLVSETEEGFIASNGFFQFRSSYYSPEFLLLIIKSNIVKEQFQQQSTGGILSAVPDQNLKHILIPKISSEIQIKITDLVKQSHKYTKQSQQLSADAKARVEQLIEEAAKK